MKKLLFTSFLTLTAMLISACGVSGDKAAAKVNEEDKYTKASYQSIPSREAERLMSELKDYIILDVRTPAEYSEGHIPNAVLLPNEDIAQSNLEMLPDKNQTIFVYCRSGRRSKDAAKKLAARGYTNIIDFGGIVEWQGNIVR